MNLHWQPFIYRHILVKTHGDQYLLINSDFLDWVRLHEQEYEAFLALQEGQTIQELIWTLQKKYRISPSKASVQIRELLARLTLNQMVFSTPNPRRVFQERVPGLKVTYIAVTQQCNLNCPYCYAEAGLKNHQELTHDEIKGIIQDTWNLGGERIVFTGGEPLLRWDLFSLAAYARERGLLTELLTNGLLINPSNIQAIGDSFDVVGVSLDGSTAAVHEQLRGPGTFSPTMAGIRLLAKHSIPLILNTVVTRLNYQDLPRLAHLAYRFAAVAFQTHEHVPFGRGAWDGLECSAEQHQEMREIRVDSFSRYPEEDFVAQRIQGEHPLKRSLRERCGTGRTEIMVDSQGNLYPCRMLQVDALHSGNIRDTPLSQLYQEGEMLQYCREIGLQELQECQGCEVQDLCAGGCRALHYASTGDLFQNDAQVCQRFKEDLFTNIWMKTGYFPITKRRLVQ